MVYGTQITNDIGVMCTNLAIQRGPHIVDKSSMYSIQANTIRSLRGLHNLESSQLSLFSDSVRHPTLRQLSFIYIYIVHTVIIEDIQELSENRSSIWNGFGRAEKSISNRR